MGHYAYELEEATTLINKADFDTVLSKIKKEVNKDKWKGYGWRDSVLNAKTLEDVITKEFGIQLVDEEDGYYRPVINNVYVSNFFSYLIEIVTPFMTDGEIRVDDEYGIKTIEFEDAKVTVIYENERSINYSKKRDKKTEKGKEYKFLVSICGGWCNGTLNFSAEDEDEAYEKAMDYVGDKLSDVFPELDIPYNVELYEKLNTNGKACAHCKREFTKEEVEYEEFEVINDEVYCYECLDSYIKKCSNCGKYLVPNSWDCEEINDDSYCSECFDNLFQQCEWCNEYVPADELAYYGNILCCNDCATNDWRSLEEAHGWR